MSDFRLLAFAETVDDVERTRIALQNRLRAHEQGGHGVDITLARLFASTKALEKDATKELERAMRDHPLGDFVKRQRGLGPKQMGRLIASIGDPYWNQLEDRPRRGPAELWAFCGYAPGQKRQKGVKSNWNANAKMRAFLVAEKAVETSVRKLPDHDDANGYDWAHRKALSPYAEVYLKARENWADRDVSDGHKHNHALRLTAKAVLRDLFLEARAVSGQHPVDAQRRDAADQDFDRAMVEPQPRVVPPGRSEEAA